MKKIIAMLLCLGLLLCGCAGNDPTGNDQTTGGSGSGLTGGGNAETDPIGGSSEPDKGVGRDKRREGSNPSFSAKYKNQTSMVWFLYFTRQRDLNRSAGALRRGSVTKS